MRVKLLSRVRLLATPWTAAYQAPLSMGFSRQEYWSGVPLPSPRKPTSSLYINTHTQQVRWRKIKQWGGKEDRRRSGKVAVVGTRGPEGSGVRGQALCACQEEQVLRWDHAQQD